MSSRHTAAASFRQCKVRDISSTHSSAGGYVSRDTISAPGRLTFANKRCARNYPTGTWYPVPWYPVPVPFSTSRDRR